jgi:hypothetical protein
MICIATIKLRCVTHFSVLNSFEQETKSTSVQRNMWFYEIQKFGSKKFFAISFSHFHACTFLKFIFKISNSKISNFIYFLSSALQRHDLQHVL